MPTPITVPSAIEKSLDGKPTFPKELQSDRLNRYYVPWANTAKSFSKEEQAKKILDDLNALLDLDEKLKIAITYSANDKESAGIYQSYQGASYNDLTSKDLQISGANQAQVFEIVQREILNNPKLKDRVHILPVTTVVYAGPQSSHLDLVKRDMENIAEHIGAGYAVLGLMNQNTINNDQFAIGGGVVANWNTGEAGSTVAKIMAELATSTFTLHKLNDTSFNIPDAYNKGQQSGLISKLKIDLPHAHLDNNYWESFIVLYFRSLRSLSFDKNDPIGFTTSLHDLTISKDSADTILGQILTDPQQPESGKSTLIYRVQPALYQQKNAEIARIVAVTEPKPGSGDKKEEHTIALLTTDSIQLPPKPQDNTKSMSDLQFFFAMKFLKNNSSKDVPPTIEACNFSKSDLEKILTTLSKYIEEDESPKAHATADSNKRVCIRFSLPPQNLSNYSADDYCYLSKKIKEYNDKINPYLTEELPLAKISQRKKLS